MPHNHDARLGFFLAADTSRYSHNHDPRQVELQRALVMALDSAAEAAGLDRTRWTTQPSGDGVLTLLPVDVNGPAVVDDFVRELDNWLERYHNRHSGDRMRLRVAMHIGSFIHADNGFAGSAPVVVSRLLDAPDARSALSDNPDANLALIVSGRVYEDFVSRRNTSLRPDDFTQVHVRMPEKDFSATAWIRVPRAAAPAAGLVMALHSEDDDEDDLRRAVAAAVAPVDVQLRTTCRCLVMFVPRDVQQSLALGLWIERLERGLRRRVRAGVTTGDVAGACDLAVSRYAVGLLNRSDSHLAVTVAESVYRSVVCAGGRKVSPTSYRPSEGEPGAWVRVVGYSVPPASSDSEPRQADPHRSPIASAPVAGATVTTMFFDRNRIGQVINNNFPSWREDLQ